MRCSQPQCEGFSLYAAIYLDLAKAVAVIAFAAGEDLAFGSVLGISAAPCGL
jgi:hypothetical protein